MSGGRNQKQRIGIFGGSFDPVHIGHAMVANYIAQYSGLDIVWMMPSPVNPLKQASPPVENRLRYEMCKMVAKKCSGVEVSDFEFDLPLPSYTYITLRRLKTCFPEFEFCLIIGSDNWLEFDKWKNYKEIMDEFPIIIYPRPGYPVSDPLPESVTLLRESPQALISSTFIRRALAAGKNMNFFVDSDVLEFIKSHRLYERT